VKRSHFLDLKQAIEETVEIVENQIKRMKEIFIMLDSYYTYESCTGLIGILDEAFQSIGPQAKNPTLRDLSILFYMQNIESIEMASFKIMMVMADKMDKPAIEQLLRECYDEAQDDRALLKQISKNYM
jgi:ferritin-like metal-binding protein YciE